MAKKQLNQAHFKNGLLREIRAKAAAPDADFIQKAIQTATKAASSRTRKKSVFARVAPAIGKRLLSEG